MPCAVKTSATSAFSTNPFAGTRDFSVHPTSLSCEENECD